MPFDASTGSGEDELAISPVLVDFRQPGALMTSLHYHFGTRQSRRVKNAITRLWLS